MQIIQSILFDKKYWTISEANAWLERHGYIHKKIHTTDKFIRYRQHEPNYNRYHYITKKLPNHTELILGFPIHEFNKK